MEEVCVPIEALDEQDRLVPEAPLSRCPRPTRTCPEAAFEAEPISQRYDEIIRELLRTSPVNGEPHLSDLERSVGLGPRNLQRRLAETGTSFQALLDEVRWEFASTYLEETRQPIATIASDLVYAGVAAFSKAFQRWTRISPSNYRQANRSV